VKGKVDPHAVAEGLYPDSGAMQAAFVSGWMRAIDGYPVDTVRFDPGSKFRVAWIKGWKAGTRIRKGG
jgi:hypothetical protein